MSLGPTLAWHFGALGDFVLSWPALGLLTAGPPASELHLVGQPAWGRLILPSAQVHDRESARLAGLFTLEPSPADSWLTGFARAVVFAFRPDPALLAHLRLAGIREIWIVPTRPGPGQLLHAGQLQVQVLRARGLAGPAQPPPCLEPPARPGPAILAPGSGGRTKRLDPGLAALAARLLGQALGPPLVALGPAEGPAYRQALAQALAGVEHGLLADPPLADLARALLAAPLYVGADSGVSHLAAALGAPCLAVFQASDPRLWVPQGPRVRICGPQSLEGSLTEMLREGGKNGG